MSHPAPRGTPARVSVVVSVGAAGPWQARAHSSRGKEEAVSAQDRPAWERGEGHAVVLCTLSGDHALSPPPLQGG